MVAFCPAWYRLGMADFSYQCPHCGETTQVGIESLGKVSLCTACAKPYLAEVPSGRLMVDGGKAGLVPTTAGASGRPDEQDVLIVNPAPFREHPIRFVILVVLILAGLTGLIIFTGETSQSVWYAILTAASALVAVGAAIMLAVQFIMTRFESLTITTQRTIWARGVIHRRTSEVQHDDIRNIQVQQNLVERLVGAGTIAISSAGQDDMEIVAEGMAKPQQIIETIRAHQRKLVKGD